MSNGLQSFLASIVIALFGLLPLGLMAMDSTATPDAMTVEDPTPPAATPTDVVLEQPAAGAQTVVITPVPRITGVSAEVARVLAANGFAARETVEGVPESVVRLLSERGAVLTIAVPEEG